MSTQTLSIGVAVVEFGGRYLVGIRGAEGPLAGYSEFPGGKCIRNERPADCACRECLEESGLTVVPVKLLLNAAHVYPHGTVDLHFWLCKPANPPDVRDQHRGFSWIAPEEFKQRKFPEGNLRLLDLLTSPKS